MNLKGKYQFEMVDSVPQTPWDLSHYEQKHENRDSVSHTVPMLLLPAMALRLLPSIALSSRLVMKNSIDLKGNKRTILTKNKFALNMEDILMVKADNSCATKTGHFYLLLTAKDQLLKRHLELIHKNAYTD
jgi:hypothetical protein